MSSTPRLPPIPPSKGGEIERTPSRHKPAFTPVEKTSAADEESSWKAFRQYIDAENTEEEPSFQDPFHLFASIDTRTRTALESSPYEALSEDTGLSRAAKKALPSPSSSPSPRALLADTAVEDETKISPLPRSRQFWQNIDEPPDLATMHSEIKASPVSRSRPLPDKDQVAAQEPEEQIAAQEPEEQIAAGVQVKRQKVIPFSRRSTKSGKEKLPSPFGPPGKLHAKEKFNKNLEGGFGEGASNKGFPKGVVASQDEEGQKYISPLAQAGKREAEPVHSPTMEPLSPSVIPAATAAARQAAPSLGIEALAIYFHMIGTIAAMVSPKGDSLTEFVLNAPSFANSKFYGAKISIEKFATAPDQLNIHLTGSNEAVAAFNQNIPNFLAAFEKGNFAFTIHQIEASYEKPLFHRKGPARGPE
jgi:hypothetical protein